MERGKRWVQNYGRTTLGGIIFALVVLLGLTGLTDSLPAADTGAREEYELPILMYHGLLKEDARQGKYVLDPQQFEEDLKYLKSHGYETVVVQDLIDYVRQGKPLPAKPVMITFDDGYYNNCYYAYPLLEQYDAKIVISPICRFTDQYSEADSGHPNYSHITWEDINEMTASGRVEIQNHTYDMHGSGEGRIGAQRMQGESEQEYKTAFTEDLTRAQNRIQEMTGWRPTCFAYPFGAISDNTTEMLKSMGFQASMTCAGRTNRITRDPECLFLLGRYLRPGLEDSEAFFQRIGL